MGNGGGTGGSEFNMNACSVEIGYMNRLEKRKEPLTAKRRNGSVDGLDENTFAMKLRREQKSQSATCGRTAVVVA
jgi:hypothetical protein